MAFFISSLIFMFFGRKAGWMISKAILYRVPNPIAFLGCIVWGMLVASITFQLIRSYQPGLFLKAIMGYGLGLYVSSPNHGLLNQSTIPDNARPRHVIISTVPEIVYIATSLAAAFLI